MVGCKKGVSCVPYSVWIPNIMFCVWFVFTKPWAGPSIYLESQESRLPKWHHKTHTGPAVLGKQSAPRPVTTPLFFFTSNPTCIPPSFSLLSRSRIGCTPGGVGSGSTVMVFDGIRLTPARLIADFSWPRRKEMRDPVLWRRRRVLGYPDAATPVQYRWVWKPFSFLKGFVGAL